MQAAQQRRLLGWLTGDASTASSGSTATVTTHAVAGRRTRSGFLAQMKHVRERMLALKQRDEAAYNTRLEKMNPLLREFIVTGVAPANFGDRFLAGGATLQRAGHSGSGDAQATVGSVRMGGSGQPGDGAMRARFEARLKKLFEDTRARLQALKASDPTKFSMEVSRLRPRLKEYVQTGVLPDFSKFRPQRRPHVGAGARLEVEHSAGDDDEDGGRRLLGSMLEEPIPRARQVPASLGVAGIKALFERTRKRMLALKDMDVAAYSVQLARLRPRMKAFVETGVMPSFSRLEARAQASTSAGGLSGAGVSNAGLTSRLRSHHPRTSEPHRRLLVLNQLSAELHDLAQGSAPQDAGEVPLPGETLEAYLTRSGNAMTRLLAMHTPCSPSSVGTCEEPEQLLQRAKSTLDQVCALWLDERPLESAALLAHTLGLSPAELQAAAQSLVPEADAPHNLPPELMALVRSTNALDLELHAYAQAKLQQALAECARHHAC